MDKGVLIQKALGTERPGTALKEQRREHLIFSQLCMKQHC